VVIKRENVQAWLNPDPDNLAASYDILDDRPTISYEHFPSSAERERRARPAPTNSVNLWKPSTTHEAVAA
jgi:hypothetical protein